MLNTALLELFPHHPSDSPPRSLRNPPDRKSTRLNSTPVAPYTPLSRSHPPLVRSHATPHRCPSSPTFRPPRGRLRTAQLMISTFCPPGDRPLYAQHRSFRIIPSSPFRLPTTILEKSPCSPLRNHSLYFSLAKHHSLLRNTSPQPRSSILRGSLQDI